MSKLVKQIFTFGFGQKNEGCYTIIKGKTKDECRQKMFEKYGQEWSFQYDSEEKAGVSRFNLKKI